LTAIGRFEEGEASLREALRIAQELGQSDQEARAHTSILSLRSPMPATPPKPYESAEPERKPLRELE
jgi:hypothetical protein